jgi:hypothetical protein
LWIGLPFNNHCNADADADTIADARNTAANIIPMSLTLTITVLQSL